MPRQRAPLIHWGCRFQSYSRQQELTIYLGYGTLEAGENIAMDNQHIEIIIKKFKTRVQATSPLFPGCKGSGKTEEEACVNLTRAISRHIAKVTEESLKVIMLSNRYTEVIVDATKHGKEHRKVFPISSSVIQLQQAILLRMKTQALPQSPLNQTEKDIHVLFQEMQQEAVCATQSSKGIEAILEKIVEEAVASQDHFIVGFPLSLN